jgi:hypothetical protein
MVEHDARGAALLQPAVPRSLHSPDAAGVVLGRWGSDLVFCAQCKI